ncbi:hypothetical protein TCAL_09037 [Tigriopus californicus]|uniref:G-protein coupled receptors family 1 profile domain-containing protein n=1 Tax=Tigriopus californicus TaxID=6832 RepID=A0A553PPM0_TIGCA|nr:hypothetical protein TCAL_09037 [Tigriopus californicus]|eukprot:TCALIF_09037-PA protein Name:"Similar to NPFR Neuropeptide F receptor (Drosophila melanogaster)" AED:0.22 eAED:0.22 QI:13/0.75/0.4/1/0.75/0.6/5/140/211
MEQPEREEKPTEMNDKMKTDNTNVNHPKDSLNLGREKLHVKPIKPIVVETDKEINLEIAVKSHLGFQISQIAQFNMNVTTHDQNEAAVNEPMPEDQEQQIQEEANMNLMPRTLPQDIINNQAVSDPAFYALSVFYCIVICGSVLGNLLVITAVLRSAHMRKVNNILIVNLAVSDLLLCTLVSPMTLMEILYKRWPGPHLQVLCILSGMVPV